MVNKPFTGANCESCAKIARLCLLIVALTVSLMSGEGNAQRKALILNPEDNARLLVAEKPGIPFKGITVEFTVSNYDDKPGKVAWSVDGQQWQQIDAIEKSFIIPLPSFTRPYLGKHSISITRVDSQRVIDSAATSIEIEFVKPTFGMDILILDDTIEFTSLQNVPDDSVDTFYRKVLKGQNWDIIDEYDTSLQQYPSADILGKYKLVVWHSDDSKASIITQKANAIYKLMNYLDAGGKLIVGGTRVLDRWYPPADPVKGMPHPTRFEKGTFPRDYLHIRSIELTGLTGNFFGGRGVNGFRDVVVDTSKMNRGFPWYGLPHLNPVVAEMDSLTQPLLIYNGKDPLGKELPCATLYNGGIYQTAYLAFPLYALRREDAQQFVQKLLYKMSL